MAGRLSMVIPTSQRLWQLGGAGWASVSRCPICWRWSGPDAADTSLPAVPTQRTKGTSILVVRL